ncbi:MAG: hypothetical protein R3C51_01170 [Parvularculaceae bacterium]
MILRRFIDHFRKQAWTAIALDFIIVVLGVFIGIQVSNWNAARAQRIDAALYHDRLVADMRLEAYNYQVLRDYYRDVRKAAEQTYAGLTGAAALTDTSLVVSAFRASQFSWAERHRATFDELVGSGNLDLITDDDLRTLVTGYYGMALLEEVSLESQRSEYRRALRMTLSPGIHEALNAQCGDKQIEGAPDGYTTLDYPCDFRWPGDEIAASADMLRADPAMPGLLRLRIANLRAREFALAINWNTYRLDEFLASAR